MAKRIQPEVVDQGVSLYEQLLSKGLTQKQVERRLGVPPVCRGEGCESQIGRPVSINALLDEELETGLREERALSIENQSEGAPLQVRRVTSQPDLSEIPQQYGRRH